MLATVSMQPMARPASAMTEASTFTLRQKGMTANTREMVREEVKRAHSDWARLRAGRARSVEGPGAPHPLAEGEGRWEEALSRTGSGVWARCLRSPSLREQPPQGPCCEDSGECVRGHDGP